MLDICVYKGGLLEMWQHYLGPHAKVIGLDVDPTCKIHELDTTQIYIGSQTDTDVLDKILKENGPIDIVLDDGGHISQHMIATFLHL
jgi:23S rRNA U2552 (ribose-2'-O)-methylase RlmE/FtsJ